MSKNTPIERISAEFKDTVSEAERMVLSRVKAAAESKDVRTELIWIFTLGKIHNRWASASRSKECVDAVTTSLDSIYSNDNVMEEFKNAESFLTTFEHDIIDGSDIHKGKITAALRDVIRSVEFSEIIRSSTAQSMTTIFKNHKVQLIGSIIIAAAFFVIGKLF